MLEKLFCHSIWRILQHYGTLLEPRNSELKKRTFVEEDEEQGACAS
jgi:hypothetical protein